MFSVLPQVPATETRPAQLGNHPLSNVPGGSDLNEREAGTWATHWKSASFSLTFRLKH